MISDNYIRNLIDATLVLDKLSVVEFVSKFLASSKNKFSLN